MDHCCSSDGVNVTFIGSGLAGVRRGKVPLCGSGRAVVDPRRVALVWPCWSGRAGLAGGVAWDIGDVAQIDTVADAQIGAWLTLPDVADRLGIPVSRVRQLLRDHKLLAVQRPDGTFSVPAAFLDGGQIVKGLHGTLTLLLDCGYDEFAALRWLFTADASLPGTPIEAIAQNRRTAVNRR